MKTFRPVGTTVLFRLLPPEQQQHAILLPDGKARPGEFQYWQIIAIGGEVNEEKFKLKEGEVVLLGGGHPTEGIMLDSERGLFLFDRRRVVAIVENGEETGLN